MDATILICTYNRALDLAHTLDTFLPLLTATEPGWELLVVDNNSTDATREMIEARRATLPLRYLYERKQGKSHALNSGVESAHGELILLTDDDVDVDAGWIAAMLAAAEVNPGSSFFGGKVLSRWQHQPPRWFTKHADIIRSNPCVNLGETSMHFKRGDEPRFIGANMAVRRKLFADGNLFRLDLGPRGAGRNEGQVGPEELEWQSRVLAAGEVGTYVPEAVVHHRDPPWRMTEKYVRHWYIDCGRNRVKCGEVPRGRELMGAPRYLWKEYATNGLIYLSTRWFGPSRIWLNAELRACLALGSIKECRVSGRNTGLQGTSPALRRPRSFHGGIRWRLEKLERIFHGALSRMGPRAYIALRWPWPVRKPFERAALAIRPPGGGLGDELMCMPIIDEIKKRNPNCRITFLTRRPDYFKCHPSIDEARRDEPGVAAIKLAYDNVLPPTRPLITLMAECIGISQQFRRITAPPAIPSETVRKLLTELPRPLIVVQLQASDWTVSKNWPTEYWQEIVPKLTRRGTIIEVGMKPILTLDEFPSNFISMAGQTTIEDYAFIIGQANLFIGPVSSGMHLANSYDVPALIIYGGYESPLGHDYPNVTPFYTPVACAPCWKRVCPFQLECMHAISPDAVLARAHRLLEE